MKKLAYIFLFLSLEAQGTGLSRTFGFGPESISMGTTSLIKDQSGSYNTYTNPAALGFLSKTELSIGFLSMKPNLRSFGTVVIDKTGTMGKFNSSKVLGGFGQVLGLTIPIGKKTRPLTFGLAAYLPSESISRSQENPVNHPFYLTYQDLSRNVFYVFSAGFRVYDGLSLGVGGDTSIESVAYYNFRKDDSVQWSGSVVEVRNKLRPFLALVYDFNYDNKEKLPLMVGLLYRTKREFQSKIDANVEISGVPIKTQTSRFFLFHPSEWTLSISAKPWKNWTASVDISRIGWSEYKSPYTQGSINALSFGEEAKPFTDIWVPKIGIQYQKEYSRSFLKEITLRSGYFYQETFVPEQNGKTNFVDNDKHVFSLGVGIAVASPWQATDRIRLNGFFQYQDLVDKKIIKTNPTDIGAPEYQTGGNIVTYGFSLSFRI